MEHGKHTRIKDMVPKIREEYKAEPPKKKTGKGKSTNTKKGK